MNLFNFLHFNNCKREHTTTGQIPKYVLDNFKNEKIREIIITTENLEKKHLKNNQYKVYEEVMITNWIKK